MIRLLQKEEAFLLYKEKMKKDFKKEELPPFSVYQALIKQDKYQAYFYQVENNPTTYFICRCIPEAVLIVFFAVFEERRGKGIGTKAMQELEQFFGSKQVMYLEVEKEQAGHTEQEKETIQRRIRFYQKLGFYIISGLEYRLKEEEYHIMVKSKKEVTKEKAKETMQQCYQNVLSKPEWLKIEIKK